MKGVSNVVDAIKFYDEDQGLGILTEKTFPKENMKDWVTDPQEHFWQVGQPEVHYLFVKQPAIPKIKVNEVNNGSEEEQLCKKYLKAILMESDNIMQYKPLVRDKNSISSILNILRQQIEKRKMFGHEQATDFKYAFVISAIKARFDVYRNQARVYFQKFVKQCIQNQEAYNLLLTKEMGGFLNHLNQQHALLGERLSIASVIT